MTSRPWRPRRPRGTAWRGCPLAGAAQPHAYLPGSAFVFERCGASFALVEAGRHPSSEPSVYHSPGSHAPQILVGCAEAPALFHSREAGHLRGQWNRSSTRAARHARQWKRSSTKRRRSMRMTCAAAPPFYPQRYCPGGAALNAARAPRRRRVASLIHAPGATHRTHTPRRNPIPTAKKTRAARRPSPSRTSSTTPRTASTRRTRTSTPRARCWSWRAS